MHFNFLKKRSYSAQQRWVEGEKVNIRKKSHSAGKNVNGVAPWKQMDYVESKGVWSSTENRNLKKKVEVY